MRETCDADEHTVQRKPYHLALRTHFVGLKAFLLELPVVMVDLSYTSAVA